MTIFPQCFDCKRLDPGKAFTCAAFPEGIPREIRFAEHDHTKPFPGDRGILFEPKDEPKPPPAP